MVLIWKRSIKELDKNEWLTTTPTQAFSSIVRKIHKISKSYIPLRNICPSVYPFTWKNSSPTARIFTKSDIREFLEILSNIFNFQQNLAGMTGTLCEYVSTFTIISRWISLRF